METIPLNSNQPEPLLVNYYNGDTSDHVLVIVGGSGDDRNQFDSLITLLHEQRPQYNVVTFSFRGVETGNLFPAIQQYYDLKELLDYLITNKSKKNISIVCTSMGAVSTTLVATDTSYDEYLKKIVFVDPADYLEISEIEAESRTWSGPEIFEPHKAILTDKIKTVTSDVEISAVNLLLRNYGTSGYAPPALRGVDNPELFSRVNDDMVKAFYTNAPDKNKGEYIEDRQIPHAFMRDGNIEKNVKLLAKLIMQIIH